MLQMEVFLTGLRCEVMFRGTELAGLLPVVKQILIEWQPLRMDGKIVGMSGAERKALWVS